ncbi:hypothetical protein BY458DRAFT_485574 [Sporodiniella umbellata]|nr:hypothetical protein BY458DRAFT_485574 [Sporodiniella umbellata]
MVHILDHETHTLVPLLDYKSLSPIPTTESLSPPTTEEDDEDEDALKIPKKRKQSPTQDDLLQSTTCSNAQKSLQVLDRLQVLTSDQSNRSSKNANESPKEQRQPACFQNTSHLDDQTVAVDKNTSSESLIEDVEIAPSLNSTTNDENKEDQAHFTLNKSVTKEKNTEKPKDGPCRSCLVAVSPHWRKGPEGPRTLCNACGLRWCKEKKTDKIVTPKLPTKPSPLLFHRKEFLVHGLYSDETRTPKNPSKNQFEFPLPIHQGQALLDKEFELPPFIWQEKELDLIKCLKDKKPVFTKIRANLFIERKPKLIADERNICHCIPPQGEQELGCGEDCINRLLFYECDAKYCPCGAKCSNQRIQKKACDYRLEVFKTQGRGWGLRTQQAIQKGSFIIEYRGEIISQKLCEERMCTDYVNESNFYFLEYSKGEVIDACTKGTEARFINHSCVPNCHIEKWSYRGEAHFCVFASKDILAHSELSYDYNFSTFNVENAQACHCGSNSCRGTIGKKVKSQMS